MASKQPLPIYNWVVRFRQDRQQEHDYLKAAYFQPSDDDQFIVFKDGDHKTNYLVAKAEVLDIGRLDLES